MAQFPLVSSDHSLNRVFQDSFWALILLFAFLLPWFPRVAVWSVSLAGLIWLIAPLLPKSERRISLSTTAYLSMAFFIWYACSLWWSTNQADGWPKLETKMSLFFFPLVFSTLLFRFQISKWLIPALVSGTITASLFCLAMAFFAFLNTGEAGFFYKDLVSPLDFHPAYFALYVGVAAFWLLTNYLHPMRRPLSLPGWCWGGSFLYLTHFLVLLSSRMQLLAYILLLVVFSFSFLIKKKLNWTKGLLVFSGLAMAISLFLVLPGPRERMQQALNQSEGKSNTNIRVQVWKQLPELVQKAPLFGLGIGDSQHALNEVYLRENIERAAAERFNTHNQYFDTLLATGIIGLLLLLGILVSSFWLAIKYRLLWFQYSIVFLALSYLTESMLEAQRGVMILGLLVACLTNAINRVQNQE